MYTLRQGGAACDTLQAVSSDKSTAHPKKHMGHPHGCGACRAIGERVGGCASYLPVVVRASADISHAFRQDEGGLKQVHFPGGMLGGGGEEMRRGEGRRLGPDRPGSRAPSPVCVHAMGRGSV